MSIKVIFFFFQRHSLQNNADGQEILCCPAYITLLSHTNSYSCRIQILYTVVHLRVQVTIYDHLFASLHCSVWTSCLFFFTELFFPFGALWRFSVVSPARRAFGYSRFPKNETPLFFFFFSASACSEQGLQTGTVVVLSLCVWQGETGHRPHQLRSTGCVFISENKIPLRCNSVRRTWKVEGIII